MHTTAIRDLVLDDCRRQANIFSARFFEEHIEVVADCSRRLAPALGADPAAVEVAAYLHDLAAVRDPTALPDHANLGAALARELLAERGWPAATIESVAGAIAQHSVPLAAGAATPEAVCLSNADAAAQILRPAYWFYFAYGVRKSGYEDGRRWLLDLIESRWRAMIEPARELAAARYRIMAELLAGPASGG